MTDLSVVVPVYNESGSIEQLVEDFARALAPRFPRLEVIVVDDVSTDETPLILERLCRSHPWLQIHRPPRNTGHGPAVVRGLDLASAEWVFQIDSDAQFVVTEFWRLWEQRAASDLVLGVRADRHDPLHRLVLSLVVRAAASLLARRRIRDANTPFRLVRRAVWQDLRPLVPAGTLAPNIFVTVGAALRGWRITDVPVTHLARGTGAVSLRSLRLVQFSARGLRQLVLFRAHLARAPARRSTGPS